MLIQLKDVSVWTSQLASGCFSCACAIADYPTFEIIRELSLLTFIRVFLELRWGWVRCSIKNPITTPIQYACDVFVKKDFHFLSLSESFSLIRTDISELEPDAWWYLLLLRGHCAWIAICLYVSLNGNARWPRTTTTIQGQRDGGDWEKANDRSGSDERVAFKKLRYKNAKISMSKWSIVKSNVALAVRNFSILTSTQFEWFHIRVFVVFSCESELQNCEWKTHSSQRFLPLYTIRIEYAVSKETERQYRTVEIDALASEKRECARSLNRMLFLSINRSDEWRCVHLLLIRGSKFIFQFYLSILLTSWNATRECVCVCVCVPLFMGDIYFSRKYFRLFNGTRCVCVHRVVAHGYENMAHSVAPPSSNQYTTTRTGADVSVRGTETLCTLITDM